MKQIPLDWRALLAAAVLLAAISTAIYLWRRRPHDPEEIERRRRAHLNQVGRIVEGQVVEIRETSATSRDPGAGPSKPAKQKTSPSTNGARDRRMLVCYTYSISGVSYETAQDITGLEERACIERLAAGQPASVKYDPANPSNSILIADDWSGLH